MVDQSDVYLPNFLPHKMFLVKTLLNHLLIFWQKSVSGWACKIFNYWILNNYLEFLPNTDSEPQDRCGLNHWMMKIFEIHLKTLKDSSFPRCFDTFNWFQHCVWSHRRDDADIQGIQYFQSETIMDNRDQ